MPQQLIYTSSPRGLTPGRSGYCTVARSSTMRDALASRLEQLSYYQHLSLAGGQERPVCAYRIVDIRGTRYHVLSRLLDAGLDYTNRTNFLAHHLVFTPEEAVRLPPPPLLFLHWDGWQSIWQGDPRTLDGESWGNLANIDSANVIPAQTWARLTGHGVNGFGLLDSKGSAWLQVDTIAEVDVLALLAESLALLAFRERRTTPSLATWQVTFTTAYQEQDSTADFRWRCAQSGVSSVRTGGGQPVVSLLQVRSLQHTEEEQWFAERGPAPASILRPPQDTEAREGESATFQVEARGIPFPTYEWFLEGVPIVGQNSPQCVIPRVEAAKNQARQFRVKVRIANGYGTVEASARLVVQPKIRISSTPLPTSAPDFRRKDAPAPSEARTESTWSYDVSGAPVAILIGCILKASRAGNHNAAAAELQEIRRQQRQADVDSLPDVDLRQFLKDSKQAGHSELVRILESAKSRRPWKMPTMLLAFLIPVILGIIGLSIWVFTQPQILGGSENGKKLRGAIEGLKSKFSQRLDKKDNTIPSALDTVTPTNTIDKDKSQASQTNAAPPQKFPLTTTLSKENDTGRRLPKGTNYFLLAGNTQKFPSSLTNLLNEFIPSGAVTFAATNLQYGVVDLDDWLELPKSWLWATNYSSTNVLEFRSEPNCRVRFERREPTTKQPVIFNRSAKGEAKMILARNGVTNSAPVFRIILLPERTESFPVREVVFDKDHLKFNNTTIENLEALFGARDKSHQLRLVVSISGDNLPSMRSTNDIRESISASYPIILSNYIRTNKTRIQSQKESWNALDNLVAMVRQDKGKGATIGLGDAFEKLKKCKVGDSEAKRHLEDSLELLLGKKCPSPMGWADAKAIPSETDYGPSTAPVHQSMKTFFETHRKALLDFLKGPAPDIKGKQIAFALQDARDKFDSTLKTLDEMEKKPDVFLNGGLEIKINANFHPAVHLHFISP